jgi:isoleucyl-tRNA synthetase
LGESYRKVRNTLRFMLSNLGDFQPRARAQWRALRALDSIAPASLDAWVLSEFDALAAKVETAYERYDFRACSRISTTSATTR